MIWQSYFSGNKYANKQLGQHFLLNPTLTNKIAEFALPLTDCQILEIGAGPGILTESILQHQPKKLIAVEIDHKFTPYLQQLEGQYPNLEVIYCDILQIDYCQYFSSDATKKLIANLPYNITSVLFMQWLNNPNFFQQYIITIQKEYASKLISSPENNNYGSLTVLVQSYFTIKKLFNISATAFSPSPKVDSTVIKLMPYSSYSETNKFRVENFQKFANLIKQAFSAPRRKLSNNLHKYLNFLTPIQAQKRPQDLSPLEYWQIYEKIIN